MTVYYKKVKVGFLLCLSNKERAYIYSLYNMERSTVITVGKREGREKPIIQVIF